MSDYMRKIIYLEKRENGRPAGTGGFVRLEKREGKLSVCLTVPGQGSRSRLPVYVVYEKNGELYPLLLGKTDGGETWRIQIPPERMGDMEMAQICGVLAGGRDWYLAGACSGYPAEIEYGQVKFARAEKRADALPEAAPEREPEPQAEAASLMGLPGEEPEKVRDPFLAGLEEMYPFEDDEMEWCLQMKPSDFSSLPMEFWHYAKNSFLLQGFYNYRHLLYAHSQSKNYLGVPGQFHRREQYLSRGFGFPRFKGTQKKRVTTGDFGYWLKEL